MRNYVEKRVSPAFPYFGGKANYADWILDRAPPHTTYVEPFAGALNVLLRKYRSDVEVVCDLHTELILFYQVLIDRTEALIERIESTSYNKATYLAALQADHKGDELTRALNFLFLQRACFSGQGSSWVDGQKRVDSWSNTPYNLRLLARRLKGVQIILKSAFEVIPEFDSPDTFFYLDPPYYEKTRLKGKVYLHEFTGLDHLRLLRLIKRLQGSVILSGYDHPLYNKELADWDRVLLDTTASSGMCRNGEARSLRTEILWVKPQPLQ